MSDILTWDYKQYPPGFFDFIWASPPCTQYSIARRNASTPPDLVGADALVAKTFEIIAYFEPRVWIVENPATGLLPKRMSSIRPDVVGYVANYCAYGFSYPKPTMFWCNLPLYLKRCGGAGVCPRILDKSHTGGVNEAATWWNRSRIPQTLIDDILRQTRPFK